MIFVFVIIIVLVFVFVFVIDFFLRLPGESLHCRLFNSIIINFSSELAPTLVGPAQRARIIQLRVELSWPAGNRCHLVITLFAMSFFQLVFSLVDHISRQQRSFFFSSLSRSPISSSGSSRTRNMLYSVSTWYSVPASLTYLIFAISYTTAIWGLILLTDGSRYQIGWVLGKVPKGEGVIFNPKIYIAGFGHL